MLVAYASYYRELFLDKGYIIDVTRFVESKRGLQGIEGGGGEICPWCGGIKINTRAEVDQSSNLESLARRFPDRSVRGRAQHIEIGETLVDVEETRGEEF